MPRTITLRSEAFAAGQAIPKRYTCNGAGRPPPLEWSGVPRAARELRLTAVDPDAGNFVHWEVSGIPPRTKQITNGALPPGAVQAKNSAGGTGWTPPCPPSGTHRYVFTLYAQAGQRALARGRLIGRYGR